MSTPLTYSQAKKAVRKVGAAHAEGEALQSMAADILAMRLCLQAPNLYQWAQRHQIDLWALAVRKTDVLREGMDIVEAVINDVDYPAEVNSQQPSTN